jgi:polyphosphate kinase
VNHEDFRHNLPEPPAPVRPLALQQFPPQMENIFQMIRKQDVFMHHPFNSVDFLLDLLEAAAEDPNVLAIKMTIYRLAKDSRVTAALLKAAELGKHVSALFEVKARFDEENNMLEAKRLEAAGCFVIYGVNSLKTHTKMLLIVRKEGDKVTRYVHMGSGNYNERTAKHYTDIGLLTARNEYAHDISEFFNAITGHSKPQKYDRLITAPISMRSELIGLIEREAQNARDGKPSGIIIKINSLQDDKVIDSLYEASNAGVPIKLIVRGICCIRPGRKGLSENIMVRSLVGDLLEHSRIYYFHNNGNPRVFGGSADIMVRSFDRRIESLFEFIDQQCKQEVINILDYSLRDNVNAYEMLEDGSYHKLDYGGQEPFNTHKEFYKLRFSDIQDKSLF